MTIPLLEKSLVHKDHNTGIEIYKIFNERYVLFQFNGESITWTELHNKKRTGKCGEEVGIKEKEMYKAFIVENLQSSLE